MLAGEADSVPGVCVGGVLGGVDGGVDGEVDRCVDGDVGGGSEPGGRVVPSGVPDTGDDVEGVLPGVAAASDPGAPGVEEC